jgi:hypothetical protein
MKYGCFRWLGLHPGVSEVLVWVAVPPQFLKLEALEIVVGETPFLLAKFKEIILQVEQFSVSVLALEWEARNTVANVVGVSAYTVVDNHHVLEFSVCNHSEVFDHPIGN